MTRIMMLQLACNDDRNGGFLGYFEDVVVSQPGHESLMTLNGPRTKVSMSSNSVRVGRIATPLKKRITWYGNWCWDGFQIYLYGVVEVLKYLHKRGFQMEVGKAELFDKWKSSPVDDMDILRAMGEMNSQKIEQA